MPEVVNSRIVAVADVASWLLCWRDTAAPETPMRWTLDQLLADLALMQRLGLPLAPEQPGRGDQMTRSP